MTVQVTAIRAHEVLDSRGRPTLRVQATDADGRTVTAGVPSGASTGRQEAVEVRDGDPARYRGRGVLRAVDAVNGEIAELVCCRNWRDLTEVDEALVQRDGTQQRSRLGGNAIVGVSMALARLFAGQEPLWRYLSDGQVAPRLPVPHFNVLNGGAHASNALDFQEFMIAPVGASSMAEALRAGAEIYSALRDLLSSRGRAIGLGDEGGFAPEITHPQAVLDLLVRAIETAGYVPGRDSVAIAIDPAANSFRQPSGHYVIAGEDYTTGDLVGLYAELVRDYPLWSIEDGVAEDDDAGWKLLTDQLGDRVQIVGDDVFVTNPKLIADGAARGMVTAALIKPNQVGTVSETLLAIRTCRDHGLGQMVSHRSGETEDSFIADLAVGCGCGQLKSGAPARGERVAKYNRLLEIGLDHPDLAWGLPPGTRPGAP